MLMLKAVMAGATGKKLEDGRKVFRGRATSDALDRYDEVVLPKGVVLDNFMENPVLLNQHNYDQAPIGEVTALDVKDEDIVFEFAFDEADPESARIMRKMEMGVMRTFSIGFLPKGWVEGDQLVDKDGNRLSEYKGKLADGEEFTLDLTKYKVTPRLLYTDWELLEISAVSVPANPEAHLLQMAKSLVADFAIDHPGTKSFVDEAMTPRLEELKAALKTFTEEFAQFKLKGPVEQHSTPTVESSWNASSAKAKLAKWASEDGSGKKEQMAWGRYALGFGWFNNETPDEFASYKYTHHSIEGEEETLVAVKGGVTSAMASLLGGQGGEEIGDDARTVYEHLAKHYRDMEMEPPPFEKENGYSDEELVQVDDGTYEVPVVKDGDDGDGDADPVVKDPASAPELGLLPQLKELMEGASSEVLEKAEELSIQLGMVHELVEKLVEAKAKRGVKKGDVDPVVALDNDTMQSLRAFTRSQGKPDPTE